MKQVHKAIEGLPPHGAARVLEHVLSAVEVPDHVWVPSTTVIAEAE